MNDRLKYSELIFLPPKDKVAGKVGTVATGKLLVAHNDKYL